MISRLRLIFARHGNTFAADETVYCVGARNDLPLTARGIEQAVALKKFLVQSKNIPVFTIAGTLKRAAEYARTANVAFDIEEDPRLNELDYGDWAGLTNEQIVEKFGAETLRAWNEDSMWPTNSKWPEDEPTLLLEAKDVIEAITANIESGTVLFVSSNGKLRYLLKAAAPLEFERLRSEKNLKMKTGNIGIVELEETPRVVAWDVNPETFEMKS